MARLPQEEWEALVDELFALDKDHPYIGQAIDPDTDEVLSLSFDPDQPRDDSGRWSNTGGGVGKAEARAQFQSMFQNIAKPDGGFTYSPVHGTSPTKGYALAIKGHEAVFDAKTLSFDQLDEYAVSKHDVLSGKGMHLGAWHNPEDGKVYLDVSIVVDNQEEAAKLAKEYEQIAYFDLEAGKSIQAGGRQDHRVTYGGESDDSDALGRQRGGRGPDRGGADGAVQVAHRAGAHAGRDREGGRQTAAPFGNGLSYRDKLYALAFNADQPRDENGRWTGGGGDQLPDDPSKYFDADAKSEMVPLSALRTTHAIPAKIAAAEQLMRQASRGEVKRRKPIRVKSNGDGTYSVLDGNSTTAIARKHGWAKIPAHISLAFNPDQPRDENGQWVAGSGSGGAVRGGHIATFDEHDTRTGNYLGLGKADTFIRASELTPELKKALNDSLSNPDVPVFVPAVGYTFRPLGKTPLIYKASNGVSVVKTYDAGGSFHDYRVEKEMAIPLNVAMKEPSWIAESSYDEDREEFAAENAGRHTRAEAEAALAEWADKFIVPDATARYEVKQARKGLKLHDDRRHDLAFNPDQPRDEHGRWSEVGSSAPDDVPGVADAIEKVKKSGGTFTVSDVLGYVDEEFRVGLKSLRERLPDAKKSLNGIVEAVAGKLGGVFVPHVDDIDNGSGVEIAAVGVKGEKRIVEKALLDYDGDLNRIADVVRTTIAVDDVSQVKGVVDAIKSESKIDRIKNRMSSPSASGYRDAMINVILPNGLKGEIQVHVRPMLRAKNGDGHKYYKQMRSATDSSVIADLTRRSQDLYNRAWQESLGASNRELAEALNFNDHLPRSGRSALPRSIGRPETHAAVERQARTVGGLRRGLGDGALGRPARVGAVADRRAAGVMHFPTVSDVSFPSMIGAVPSAPKNRRKRRPVQYRGVTLGRKPNDLESRVLSLSEIPKRFDADMGFAVDALTKIRMRQAKSMSTDHRAEIVRVLSEVQDGMRRYGAFEMRQECARQGLRLSVNTERHDCYSLSADAVDAIGDAMSDRVQLAADQIQAEWRAHLSGLSATAKRTGRSLASLSAQAEARVSSGLRTAVRPMLTEAFALGRRYEMKRIAAKARRRTDVITLRTVDEDDLERLVDYVIQTAVMDTSTCEPCAEADGLVFEYGDDDMLLYEPPFYQCLGGGNCRCSQIYVLKDGSTWDVSEA